jgi:probable F420-dependent oxidoreductase
VHVGAVFPQTEIGDDPAAIRDFAQAAEALGYSHILVYDHVLGATHDREPRLTGPYTESTPFHEVFVLLGFFAAATERIELATGVVILPQRQTALVAKQAAEVDVLSGGRLRLGIGTGWNYVEYDSLNEDFHNRGKRQEEQVEVLRKLWSEPVLDYSGKWHRIERAGIKPLPKRPIPIWFGGFNDVAYRRGARLGDGFIFGGAVKDALAAIETIKGFLAEEGRDTASFGFEALVNWQAGPERWTSDIEAFRAAGATHVTMRDMNAGMTDPRQHIEALRTYAEAVGIRA